VALCRGATHWTTWRTFTDPALPVLHLTMETANMEPLRGWGPRQKRLTAHVPHGHWKTLTFVAGPDFSGLG
jgi:hypothetical protein